MEDGVLMSTLLDSGAWADTSLALPDEAETSLSSESADKNRRVQEQVRCTLRRKSKTGRSSSINTTYGGLDDADGYNSNTRRPYRQGDGSPTPNQTSSSVRRNYWTSLRGMLPVSEQHMKLVGALLDTPNSAQQHTPPNFRGTVTRTSMSQPGITPRQSERSKSLSASPAFQQSPANTWSHRQSVVKYDKQTVQRGMNSMSVSTHLDGSLTRQPLVSQTQKSNPPSVPTAVDHRRLARSKSDGGQKSLQVKRVAKAPKMTMNEALRDLSKTNEEVLIRAARYIQHECLHGNEARNEVSQRNGIQRLLALLEYDNEEVQCTVAGALRNAVYTHNENKSELKTSNGLPTVLDALQNSRHKETIVELAGLLWNLSSDDTIKELFEERYLHIITKCILVPSSGLHAADNPKDEMIADPRAFCCATGCLRNLSSAGPNVRKGMRECEKLIDSLAYYMQGTVASGNPDDQSTENCAGILQNLTYQAESDYMSQTTEQDVAPEKTNVGCLPILSSKPMKEVEAVNDAEDERLSLVDQKNPQGADWLWSKAAVRLYLSLLARSKQNSTRQAALGALQNLTVGKKKISECVALTIVEITENLRKIKDLLDEDSPLEQTIYLINNLCNYPRHHNVIFSELLPGVLNMLHCNPCNGTKENLFQILAKLSLNDVTRAKAIIKDDGVRFMLTNEQKGKAENAVNNLRDILWEHKGLHKDLRESGIGKHPPKKGQ